MSLLTMDLQHVLRRSEPAILNSSGTCRAQAGREFFRLVEILFPLPNLGVFKSINSISLRRNAPSSFSHSHGAGPVPTSPDEGMSSRVTGFSFLSPWRQKPHSRSGNKRSRERKHLVRKHFSPLKPCSSLCFHWMA